MLAVAIFEYLKFLLGSENQNQSESISLLKSMFPSESEIIFLITHFLMSLNPEDSKSDEQKVVFTQQTKEVMNSLGEHILS